MASKEAEGLAQLHEGLKACQRSGAKLMPITFLSLLCEACLAIGQVEAGGEAMDEAQALLSQIGEYFWKAELHRLRGELFLVQDGSSSCPSSIQVEGATTCFQQALDIARQQQAKSLELRAAIGLSRLCQQQGKNEEARELLAPIYNWFTEGFDTADLIEAKHLLDELSAERRLPTA